MRAAVRVSLVAIGTAIIVLAVVNLVGAVSDGGAVRVAWAAMKSAILGGVGGVVARAGLCYDDSRR